MSLLNNIQNYLNFSKQTNFDANSDEAMRERAKAKAEINNKYMYNSRAGLDKKPESAPSKANTNDEKIAKLQTGIKEIDKNLAKASDEDYPRLTKIRDGYADTVNKLGGEVDNTTRGKVRVEKKQVEDNIRAELKKEPTVEERRDYTNELVGGANKTASANKFLAEKGSTKAVATDKTSSDPSKARSTPADRFLAEKGGTKAKATPKKNYIPWDKDDVATGASWKNGAGQTIKSYRDKDGNIYIRGAEGKVTLFDAQGNPTKAATGRYLTMAKAFKAATKPAVADIREKAADGTTTTIAESKAASTRGNTPIPAKTKLAGNDLGKNNPNRINR